MFGEAGDWELKANTLMALEDLYESTKDHTNAMSVLHQAHDIYEKIHYPKMQRVYDPMSCVSQEMGKVDDAQKYGISAMQIAESQKDSSVEMAVIYDELGVAYHSMGDLPHAIEYYQKGLIFSEKNDDTARTANLVRNLVSAYNMANKSLDAMNLLKSKEKKYTFYRPKDRAKILSSFVDCYVRMKEYDSAKPYVNELVGISEKYPVTDDMQQETFRTIIPYYLATKEYKNAEHYCSYNEIYCKKINWPYELAVDYKCWFRADTGLGNCVAALLHYRMYTIIKDSLFKESFNKNFAQQQTQFETEKKEKDIQLLTQNNQLQQTQLKQSKLTRNFILGGTTMMTLLLGLGYNRYRLKQRSNKQLEIQRNEINNKNEALQQLVKEKEWLIKEIHHRVKNNLQIVMSLLNTQSQYLDSDAAKKAISESRHRMQAMSLIHQRLYQAENVSTVNMLTYISELTEYLSDSYDTDKHIRFVQHVDDIRLDVAQAIPMGLILNEAITNAVKYAFPGDMPGTINISMESTAANTVRLKISDNGIGMPIDHYISNSNSLGMSMMRGLANQLGGIFDIKNNSGTEIVITFSYVNGLNAV